MIDRGLVGRSCMNGQSLNVVLCEVRGAKRRDDEDPVNDLSCGVNA